MLTQDEIYSKVSETLVEALNVDEGLAYNLMNWGGAGGGKADGGEAPTAPPPRYCSKRRSTNPS